MEIDLRSASTAERYKVLTNTITPRPIAWITSLSKTGVVNAAPYSFFNAVGHEPPLVALGLLKEPGSGGLKNTAANIISTGEFVVNLVCEADADRMNLSSIDAPADVSEIELAGVETVASVVIAPPRIASAPVSFECRKLVALDIGTQQTVVLGEVLYAHIADQFVLDPQRLYLTTPAMKLVGRTHGSGWYVRNSDAFQLDRPRPKRD
ncbi:MAG: flavin reductase protein [Phenylobacterium sp.]|nr:flavin reductase protein [Phenylobacterium sp.]